MAGRGNPGSVVCHRKGERKKDARENRARRIKGIGGLVKFR